MTNFLKKIDIMNDTNKKCVYLIILTILGSTIVGCISIQDFQKLINDTDNYDTYQNISISEPKINNADDHTKQIIYSILNNSDKNVSRYISSIDIVPTMAYTTCDSNSTGCVVSNFTVDGRLLNAKIYILSPYSYNGICNTFEHTLYHEKGHVVYFYKFGDHDIKGQDNIYKESIESYAEKYADIYSEIKKDGCDKRVIEKLRSQLGEKEKIYEYANGVLSKWNKYNDSGIPANIYEEYQYDYNLYVVAKKEYDTVLRESNDYMKMIKE